ncbi:MAG: GLUG motif-containing protein, partial [Eubacterium sp.]
MKKRGRLRKGLAMLLSLAMVVGLMPGAGTIKVSAAEGEASGSVAAAEGYDANGFCTSYELTNGTWALKSGATVCATHGETCNGYQPATLTTGTHEVDGDSETQDEVYEIGNAGQLYWFADKVNNEYDTYKDKNAVLTTNITVNEGVLSNGELNTEKESTFRSWTPIGYWANSTFYSYNGIFDGAGYTIKGLYVKDGSKLRVGLFALNGGIIKKVNIADSYFLGKNMVGGICGQNYYGNIETCNNNGSIVSGTGNYAGGVCGWNMGTVINCENTGDVYGGEVVGGVCGSIGYQSYEASVKNCSNKGNVTGTGNQVGGVSGKLTSGSLETSYNIGEVQGSSYVGGVCGYQYGSSSNIDSCYNTGNVTGTSADAIVGGVCGIQSTNGLTSNCYSTGSVICTASDTTNTYVGGVCGFQRGAIKNCYYDNGKFTGKAIDYSASDTSQSVYVEGKTSQLFSNGGVAYLLNSRAAEGSPVWYQNIDNRLAKDAVPVLDSSHGIVYASKPCPVIGSNNENTVSTESKAHSFDNSNICSVCGKKGDVIDDPAIRDYKPTQEGEVYQIKSKEELYYFVALVNGRLPDGTQDASASAVLKQDIVVNENLLEKLNADGTVKDDNTVDSWVAIGYDGIKTYEYTGTFDGGGHKISGLYLDSENYNIGLFGVSSGTIKNVTVEDCYFKGKDKVGAVCGYNKGLIENCTAVNGSVCALVTEGTVGGICGSNDKSITNCSTQVTVECSGHQTASGGICGSNNANGTISKCHSSGNIQNEMNDVRYGGVCGINSGKISDCYNETAIKNVGNSATFGGICGKNDGEIITSYNTGEISYKDDNGSLTSAWYGGICGWSKKTISDCYNSGYVELDVTDWRYGGGICGNNGGQIKNCYDGQNVANYTNYRIANCGTIINCYYLYTKSDTSAKTSAQFASGEVAYLLNEGKTDSNVVWRQTLTGEKDTIPVLDSEHGIVYASKPCESEFANTEFTEEKQHNYQISTDGAYHQCSYCKKTEQHADVATFTVDDENHSITATCPSCGNLGTITLSASDATYDGADKAASISGEIKGFDTPSIVYEKKGTDGSFATIDSTPKGAGTYRASITYTVDETNNKVYSVSTEYTISPATPTIAWESSSKTVNYTGNAITEEKIGAPAVTLVNEESYNGTIQYSYRTSGSTGEFTSGLPTEVGTYEVKAVVDADGNYAKAEKSMTLTIAWLTGVADATLKDQSGKSLTGDDWWAQSVTFTPPEDYTICGTVDGTYGDSYTYDAETAEAGTDVTYYLKNKTTGEIAQKSTIVHVDTTAPDWSGENDGISIKTNKWKSLLSTISFGLFYKETVDVTVSASDSLSGVAKYYYYVDTSAGETVKTKEELDALANGESDFTECDVTGTNATQNITSLSAGSSCVVYVYAVDAVGNKSDYICSNGVVIDKTSPIISNISTPSKGSGEDATLTDTKADMTFTASESGTYFYIVKAGSEGAPAAIADFATSNVDENTGMTVWNEKDGVTAAAMTADGNNKISLSGLTANTAYTVYVIGVDRAGNASGILSQTFTTCKTMPKVTTNPTLSGTYGTAVSAMTLTNGVAIAGDTVIEGTWKLTDEASSDVPSVGATKSYEVIFTPADKYNDQYETVKVAVKPTVEAKAVTVTADDKTKTYGQENPELTFKVPEGSLVGSDNEETLGVTLNCEATKDSPVKEGGYAITGISESANYAVTVTPGILTINQAAAEITVAETEYSKTFGDAAFDLGVT